MMNFKKITTLALAGTFAFGMAAATTSVEAAHKEEPPKIEQPAPELHKDKQHVDSRVDSKQQSAKDADKKHQKKAPKEAEAKNVQGQPAPAADHR